MAYDDMGDAARLETLVDTYGLSETIDTLADVCFKKAQHLRENWKDYNAALAWDKAGIAIDNLVRYFLPS